MNEEKLKLALCAMLPTELEAEEVCWATKPNPPHTFRWKKSNGFTMYNIILPTEWLNLCHMVEQQRLFGPFNRHLRVIINTNRNYTDYNKQGCHMVGAVDGKSRGTSNYFGNKNMNKRDFTIWEQGVRAAMEIMHQNITCKQVEDNVEKEIQKQAKITEQVEQENSELATEFEKFFFESNPRNKVLGQQISTQPCKKCGKPGAVLYFPGGYMCENGCQEQIPNNDFGWEEPVKGASTKKDNGWQSRFKKHFGNGPVNRKARK